MPYTHLRRPRDRLPTLATALLLLSTAPTGLAQTPQDTKEQARMKADCRMEGEAGGLSGGDLERFVAECVADLMAVELHNTQRAE